MRAPAEQLEQHACTDADDPSPIANGLIAAWQGKTSFQQGDAAPAAASPASTQPAFGQPPATVVPAAGKLSSKAVAFPLLGPGSALDVYLFLHEGAPPTPDDLATQYSTLVPHGRGAWGTLSGSSDADPLDLSAAAYDELLQDPLRDTAVFAGAKGVLPAARWRNVTIADWSLARDVDLTLQLSDNVRLHNGSIWADIFAVPADAPLRELAARNSPATMRIRRRECFACRAAEPCARLTWRWGRTSLDASLSATARARAAQAVRQR